MASTLEELGTEVNQIAAAYEAGFAGQSRSSRNVDELDTLMKRLETVVERIDAVSATMQAPELGELRQIAAGNLELYKKELEAIQEAKAAGPDFEEFARQAAFANFVFARYFRHFAGKDRVTRDPGLLAEMIEDLKQVRQRMAAIAARNASASFKRDAELVGQNLELYQNELREVAKAQSTGTPEEQASVLAAVANAQFEVYRNHFAGHPRVTRRPAHLQRVIDNLRRIRDRMKSLHKGGLTVEFNTKNIEVVEGNLKTYETEVAEIRKARQGTPIGDIMGMLGSAANEVFEAYRQAFAGKDRRTVDPALLSVLCDRLGEIARQMADFGRAEHNDNNERNLDIVISQLAMYEGEFEAIVRAQAAAATSGGDNPNGGSGSGGTTSEARPEPA
jgi:uncharacterized protein YukE